MSYKKMKVWLERDEEGELPELTETKRKRLTEKAFNYCCWAVGNAPKTKKQLEGKLRMKNCPEDIITSTLEKMASYGYLDDSDFAKSFMESKQHAGWGARKIRMELNRKGIDPDILNEVLEEDDLESEEERARDFAQRKIRSIPMTLDRRKRVDRLVRAMVSRGFDMGLAFQMVNELIDHTEDFPEEG